MYDIRLGAICKKSSPGKLGHGVDKIEKRYELAVGEVLEEHKIAREKREKTQEQAKSSKPKA